MSDSFYTLIFPLFSLLIFFSFSPLRGSKNEKGLGRTEVARKNHLPPSTIVGFLRFRYHPFAILLSKSACVVERRRFRPISSKRMAAEAEEVLHTCAAHLTFDGAGDTVATKSWSRSCQQRRHRLPRTCQFACTSACLRLSRERMIRRFSSEIVRSIRFPKASQLVNAFTQLSPFRAFFDQITHHIRRSWSSGRILACHAGGPGSIPGLRIFFVFFPPNLLFVFFADWSMVCVFFGRHLLGTSPWSENLLPFFRPPLPFNFWKR